MARVKVDMSKVEEGGGPLCPPGEYAAKIVKGEVKKSSKGKPMISWELKGVTGDAKGKKLYHNTSLQPQALFNLRNMLVACGIKVPKSAIVVDTEQMVGKTVGITVDEEEYKGKMRPRIVEFFAVDSRGKRLAEGQVDELDEDLEEEDDEEQDLDEALDEEEDADEEDSEEEEEEDDPYEGKTRDELKAICKEKGVKVVKSDTVETLKTKLSEPF
jgi:hypothetical protein